MGGPDPPCKRAILRGKGQTIVKYNNTDDNNNNNTKIYNVHM